MVTQQSGVRRFLKFIAIGSVFATVEEFLTVVVLRHDAASYVFTLLVLFPVFLTFVYFSSRLLDRLFGNPAARDLTHFVAYGCAGLMIEWFLIGLSPWSNPQANPVLMAVFQLGMFSFWATVAFVPRLFTAGCEPARSTCRSIVRFYVPYFSAVYLASAVVSAQRRFAVVIGLILFGYLFLSVFYVRHFRSFGRIP